jgi:23S rRNA (guanine2445-N2)-methyltransferase / 23S rRNA (guanine2069-N7)-methyltransferase
VYDKDIPEFAVSVDLYERFAHVQEYQAPDTIDADIAAQKLKSIMSALPSILDLSPSHIFLKIRQKQTGNNQYQKKQNSGEFHEVSENNCRFLVNFTDYLDTGLFLDHRNIRELIGSYAKGKHFLNLFSYTGTATIYAALNGAKSTTSVDSSKHYNSWARKNLALNGFSETAHHIHQADCMTWIRQHSKTYDLIFLDPPTFSNSKDRQSVFDIQKYHVQLIQRTANLLNRDGILIFSNNFRKFKMDFENLKTLTIEDITPQTIPLDFERNYKIHNCWIIKKTLNSF